MRSKKIQILYAEPGMVVAKDIYTPSGQLIVSAGTTLTDQFITRLKFYSVMELSIEAAPRGKTVTITGKPTGAPLTHVERVKASPEFKQFSRAFYSSFVSYREQLNSAIRGNSNLDIDELLGQVSDISATCNPPGTVFDMMMGIRNLDDPTYVHSMNVALLCKMFAGWLKFSEEETKDLVLAGLLHDIGKMLIPKSILSKPGKLTNEEYQTIKSHSQLGYSILKTQNLNPRICLAALQHHERCDGQGYPLKLTLEQIDPYAKIVAIADVYDALTAARVYRGPICPLEVIGIFQNEGLTKYDPKYLLIFLDGIMNAYLNYTVRLSNGEIGRIVMMHRDSLSRPVIYISEDRFIDLAKEPNITVLEIM